MYRKLGYMQLSSVAPCERSGAVNARASLEAREAFELATSRTSALRLGISRCSCPGRTRQVKLVVLLGGEANTNEAFHTGTRWSEARRGEAKRSEWKCWYCPSLAVLCVYITTSCCLALLVWLPWPPDTCYQLHFLRATDLHDLPFCRIYGLMCVR